MNKEIESLMEKKISLTSEVEKETKALTNEATDDQLKELDKKYEELKSIDLEIQKLKKIEEFKRRQKELKAKEAVETDSDDDTEEDKITEEKEKSMNSFNINKEFDTKVDPKLEVGLRAVGDLFVKTRGANDAYNELTKSMKPELAKRIVTKATTTTSDPIIPQDMRGYIEALYTDSVIAKIANIENMPLGQLTMLRESGLVNAAYVDEGEQFPYSSASWDRVQFSWKKCAAMASITREAAQMSPFEIAARIQKQLGRNISLKADNAFINNLDNGTLGNQPKGLAGLVLAENQLTATTALTNIQTISQDLGKTIAALENNIISSEGAVFIMHPGVKNALMFFANDYQFPFLEQLSRGQLFGKTVYTTTQIATNLPVTIGETTTNTGSTIYLVQPEYLYIGDSGNSDVEVTNVGSFSTGGVQQNMFGQDQIAFKMSVRHDFNVTQPNAVVALTVNDWSIGNFASMSNGINYAPFTGGSTASGAKSK